jgi:hypothetical protein
MHTVELMEAAIRVATAQGYRLRREPLAGQGGGACTIRGEKWLFLDVTADYHEQLEVLLAALRADRPRETNALPAALLELLERREAA